MREHFEIIYDAINYIWYFFKIAIIFFRKCSFNINHNNKTQLYIFIRQHTFNFFVQIPHLYISDIDMI